MPLPLYPENPVPAIVYPGSIEWPAIKAKFDSVYTQVRQLTNRGLRTVELEYPFLRIDQLDALLLFYNRRKGEAERFDLRVPLEAFVDPGFEIGTTNEWVFETGTQISTNPANARTGTKAAQITALNGTVRNIYSVHLGAIGGAPLFPGDQVLFSGWAKADGAPGAIGTLQIEYYDAADAFVAVGPSSGDVTLSVNYDQYAPAIGTVPAQTAYARIRLRSTAAATTGRNLFFDDLSVKLQIPVRFASKIEWQQRQDSFERYACIVRFEEAP